MSSTGASHRVGIQKEQRRISTAPAGVIPDDATPPPIRDDTLMTPGNYGQIILTKQALTRIVNQISSITKRQLSAPQVDSVIQYIKRLPESRYYNKRFAESCELIARDYVHRAQAEAATHEENGDVGRLAGLEETGPAALSEYMKAEVMQLTHNEDVYYNRAFADRRGNALIDRDRVAGLRSSPDSVVPAASLPYGPRGPAGPISNYSGFNQANLRGGHTGGSGSGSGSSSGSGNGAGGAGGISLVAAAGGFPDELLKVMIPAMESIRQTLDPQSVTELLRRNSGLYNTYDNISMVRQTVLFDSRNSKLTASNNQLEWDIHTAGQAGQLGAVRMEDNLQKFIAVRVRPFWLPVVGLADDYYDTIHMDIKELTHQHVPVTEHLGPTQDNSLTSFYIYEFNIRERQLNRVYLVPKNPTFCLRKPVSRLERLTVDFRTPFELLTIQPDRVTFAMLYGNPTVMVSVVPHNLSSGDRIYIYNSSSGSATIDTQLTQGSGWFVSRVDDYTISIPFDTSSLIGSQSGIQTYLGSKRVVFELEFVGLDS